jgi:protein gp37
VTATEIEWADEVDNPTTGCDRVSTGCDHCYALTMARRLKAMGQPKYQRDGDPKTSGPGFGITEHPEVLDRMLRRRKPTKVFLNSMSDLFHAGVSDAFLAKTFAVMAATPHVTYQVLTKRHARMRSLLSDEAWLAGAAQQYRELETGTEPKGLPWPLPNIWLGVSAENQQWFDIRTDALLQTPAAVRWVSAEPLIGPIVLPEFIVGGLADCPCESGGLCPPNIDWIVIGGESGPGARPMDLRAAGRLVAQCRAGGIPVLVKQLGTRQGGAGHHDIATFPAELQVREYPGVFS